MTELSLNLLMVISLFIESKLTLNQFLNKVYDKFGINMHNVGLG